MTVLFSLNLNQNEANKVSVTFASPVFTITSEQARYWLNPRDTGRLYSHNK